MRYYTRTLIPERTTSLIAERSFIVGLSARSLLVFKRPCHTVHIQPQILYCAYIKFFCCTQHRLENLLLLHPQLTVHGNYFIIFPTSSANSKVIIPGTRSRVASSDKITFQYFFGLLWQNEKPHFHNSSLLQRNYMIICQSRRDPVMIKIKVF